MSDTRTGGGRAVGGRSGGTPATPEPGTGGRAAARKGRKGGRRKTLKILAMVTAGVVVIAVGGGIYLYEHLNGNIKTVSLFNGTSGSAGTEKVDAFGRSPINMLVIGSDGRSNAADCKIGGVCGPGANADVEMLVHISADRSNATVMSIPRDLMTDLPACSDPTDNTSFNGGYAQINSALQYGPGCSVAAIHKLTGIPIDHFAEVDFSGVVSMSDAVGGVSVCVDSNVYDPNSHLKLKQGTHTLKGLAALEFVRTRHGFGDGSDLGRTYAQHTFMTQTLNKLKSAGTLSDPTALWSLANAATKALTVDTSLGSIPKLIGLADDLNKVPTNRMTFTTMQNSPDPKNNARVVIAPGAQTLFDTIANDQSLTTGTGAKTPVGSASAKPTGGSTAAAAPAPPAVPNSRIAVRVENGSGITGRATTVHDALIRLGYSSGSTITNAPGKATATGLYYGPGHQDEARQVAASLGLHDDAVKQGTSSHLTLVIGSDWAAGSVYPGGTASAAPVNTKVALSNSHAQTGDQKNSCVHVSTQRTIPVDAYHGITPQIAYSRHPEVPDSAP